MEKVIREWKEVLSRKFQNLYLGTKNHKIEIDCLAFADDIAIFSEELNQAKIQIEVLKEIAEKVGLSISFEKTEFIATRRILENKIETKYGTVLRKDKFKYLGEWIQPNDQEKESLLNRKQRLELAVKLSRNVYNKRSISIKAKIRHYNTVVRPEVLYAAESLSLNYKGLLHNLIKTERRVLRTILGPKRNGEGVYRLRPTAELYSSNEAEKLEDAIRKRRVSYFAHLLRMSDSRLTKRIFDFLYRKKNKNAWLKGVMEDMEEMGINEEGMLNRATFREAVRGFAGFRERNTSGRTVEWSEERREAARMRLKKYWDDVKAGRRKRKS